MYPKKKKKSTYTTHARAHMSRPIEEMIEGEGLNISVCCIWFCGWICYLGVSNMSRLLLRSSQKRNLDAVQDADRIS